MSGEKEPPKKRKKVEDKGDYEDKIVIVYLSIDCLPENI